MNFSDLHRLLADQPPGAVAFVGLGNADRGDDGAGLALLETLRSRPELSTAVFIAAGVTPENVLGQLIRSGCRVVVFLDAGRWGGAPGEIALLDGADVATVGFSTHTYSIRLVERYLEAAARLTCHYVAIQPLRTEPGAALSDPVRRGIEVFVGEGADA